MHTVCSEMHLPAFSLPRPLCVTETALWKANPRSSAGICYRPSSRGHKAFTEVLLSHVQICNKFLPSAQRTGRTNISVHCSLLLFFSLFNLLLYVACGVFFPMDLSDVLQIPLAAGQRGGCRCSHACNTKGFPNYFSLV